MQLPKELADKVAAKLDATNISRLRTASAELTNRYHAHSQLTSAQSSDQHLAYIAARMPATYAVCRSVLNQLSPHQLAIKSLLDLGAGPGTATLATLASFPQLEDLTLVDKDTQFQSLALDFLPSHGSAIQYELEDITRFIPQNSYDLVVCSYALNGDWRIPLNDAIHKTTHRFKPQRKRGNIQQKRVRSICERFCL